jgi:hypothetical protein
MQRVLSHSPQNLILQYCKASQNFFRFLYIVWVNYYISIEILSTKTETEHVEGHMAQVVAARHGGTSESSKPWRHMPQLIET